jgi:hypothetical protein
MLLHDENVEERMSSANRYPGIDPRIVASVRHHARRASLKLPGASEDVVGYVDVARAWIRLPARYASARLKAAIWPAGTTPLMRLQEGEGAAVRTLPYRRRSSGLIRSSRGGPLQHSLPTRHRQHRS